jgi:branched-chain amino acid aminotransferase
VPLSEAHIALDDPGYLLGDGLFETLRARKGNVFRWDLHAERLAAGLSAIGIHSEALILAERAARGLAVEVANENDDVYLRVQVSRTATGEAYVTALARPLPKYPARLYGEGARLAVAAWRRHPADPLAGVKSLSYLPQVWTRRAAQARGFDDALILNTRGKICEASYANVIAGYRNAIYAPSPEEGALDGVTRRVLLAGLDRNEYAMRSRLSWSELETADEVLLVSTLAGVIPVVEIEGVKKRYAGPAGELARRLTMLYVTLLDSEGRPA